MYIFPEEGVHVFRGVEQWQQRSVGFAQMVDENRCLTGCEQTLSFEVARGTEVSKQFLVAFDPRAKAFGSDRGKLFGEIG